MRRMMGGRRHWEYLDKSCLSPVPGWTDSWQVTQLYRETRWRPPTSGWCPLQTHGWGSQAGTVWRRTSRCTSLQPRWGWPPPPPPARPPVFCSESQRGTSGEESFKILIWSKRSLTTFSVTCVLSLSSSSQERRTRRQTDFPVVSRSLFQPWKIVQSLH